MSAPDLESKVNKSGLCGGPSDSCKNHRWAFEVSFKSGILVGFVVFAISYTVFFMYYFNLWVGSKKRSKKMRTRATVLTASRKKKGKEVDQVTPLPTLGFDQEKSIEVLFLFTKIYGTKKRYETDRWIISAILYLVDKKNSISLIFF